MQDVEINKLKELFVVINIQKEQTCPIAVTPLSVRPAT